VAVGLLQARSASTSKAPTPLSAEQVSADLAGSPPTLAALHRQAGQILEGGLPAVRARLRVLAGTPVVLNKWASWCAPCRAEFGVFAHVAATEGRSVAFVGIDSNDSSRADALAFLHSHPISYPTYYDAGGSAGLAITDSAFTPVTVFYNSSGGQYIHQGQYPTVAKLEQDVRRYALGG
jgi:cytochrome c biogenesis protein CcmG/thiol:disulfide interchange protein DsbE